MFTHGAVRTPFGDLALHHRASLKRSTNNSVVLIRPEQIKFCPAGPADALAGRILDYEYRGHDLVIRITPGSHCGADVLLVRVPGGVTYPMASPVTVTVEGPVVAWCMDADGEPHPPSVVRSSAPE